MEKIEHYSEIKRYIKSKVAHPEDVEDLVQHIYLKYYEIKGRKKDIQNHKAYLLCIAKIKIADYYRQKQKQPQIMQLKFADKLCDTKYKRTSNTKEIREDIGILVSKLPPQAKEAVELRFVEQLSYEQAAKRANCSIKAFRKRYYKTLKIIREKHNSFNQKDL